MLPLQLPTHYRKLHRIGSIKEIGFETSVEWNETILPCDLTLAGSDIYTVGAATKKAQVPAFVFTRGPYVMSNMCPSSANLYWPMVFHFWFC